MHFCFSHCKRHAFATLLVAVILMALVGCAKDDDHRLVDFSKTVVIEEAALQPAGKHPLRVAVAAMISPKETFIYHRKVLDYLGDRLDRDIELIQRKTYREINQLFGKGLIDLAFICSGPYALGKEKYGFQLLATPEIRGSHFYRSYLIVNKNSGYLRLEDLRDKVFAFTDVDSNTGRLVPIYWLSQIHERPQTFFSQTLTTFGHDNSILAVAWNLADGAAVDGLVWEYYNRKKPALTAKTRIIKKSQPFGIPPLVASRYLPKELQERIRRLLFSMHRDPEGREILRELMITRFIQPRDEWYTPIRRMQKALALFNGKSHASAKLTN